MGKNSEVESCAPRRWHGSSANTYFCVFQNALQLAMSGFWIVLVQLRPRYVTFAIIKGTFHYISSRLFLCRHRLLFEVNFVT